MTEQLAYLLGTGLSWAGWLLLFIALFRLVAVWQYPAGPARSAITHSLIQQAIIGAVCLVVAAFLPMNEGFRYAAGDIEGKWRFPLVWIVMSFYGWGVLACLAIGVKGLVGLAMEPTQLQADPGAAKRGQRFRTSAVWIGLAAFFVLLYRHDEDTFTVVRGGVYFAPTTVFAILVLAALAVVVMAITGRAIKSRNVTKSFFTQIVLLAGSVVFGLPFLWAVITSFKEDVDMSSPTGLVWIPRVQQEIPFRDADNPLVQTQFMGRTVEARITQKLADGSLKLDVQHPEVLRGRSPVVRSDQVQVIDDSGKLYSGTYQGKHFEGFEFKGLDDNQSLIEFVSPPELAKQRQKFKKDDLEPVRHIGLRWKNYPEAIEFLPLEANYGLTYLKNTLVLVCLSVLGTLLSSSIVAYAFARMHFPGKEVVWRILLSTMMLPAMVTLLPQFLIFKTLGWIDTLLPIWVPTFFANAYFVFMLRQFFSSVPMELEDASKVDGCSYLKSYWSVMLPQVKPALAVVAIWTFMGVWNNFQGPLVYINSPEKMPITYALQLYQGDRFGEPGLLMAFSVLTVIPVLLLFFVAQRYFIEGVSLSGMGGR